MSAGTLQETVEVMGVDAGTADGALEGVVVAATANPLKIGAAKLSWALMFKLWSIGYAVQTVTSLRN